VKTPEPGARRYFFIPSSDGAAWELAEATFRRRAWEVAYPGQRDRDRFDALPPPKADWVEMVPPGRGPKAPWPPRVDFLALGEKEPERAPKAVVVPVSPPEDKPKAKPGTRAPPKKAVPGLSKELHALLAEQQRTQKVPDGMAQCPLCGTIVAPTKTKKVRTHDDPLKGARCAASNRPLAEFAGRPPRPARR